MKKRILIFLFISLCSQSFSQNIIDHKVDSIISLMTLNEKIAQMYNNSFMTTPDNTRLNIPGFIMDDGPHGVRFQTATSFPGGITMAATWDTNLGFDIARAMAEEFHSFGKHQQLGPVMDLCRDPRNGRSAESGGEDPYLIGVMGAYYVKGLQSTPVMATIKHYNANFREKNRYDNSYTLSYRQLMEHNGFNFRYPMQEGGAFSIMNAYNKINGQKCAENDTLLNLILRKHWGFPFYVVSDWGSIYAPQADIKKAVLAGCNVEMGSDLYKNNIAQMITAGTLTEANINASVKTIIKTKMLAGLINDTYPIESTGANTPANQELCRQAARESMVLLKNKNNVLPLPKAKITIALIGPNAPVARLDGFGSSAITPPYAISPLQGIKTKLNGLGATVTFVKGCAVNSTDTSGFAAARAAAKTADYVIYIGGLDSTQEGEGFDIGGDRKSLSVELPGVQQTLINKLALVNSKLIVVLQSGGICAVPSCINSINSFIYSFYPGQEGGNALADVLFGDYNPGGRLPVTMPVNDAQMPAWNFDYTDDYNAGYRWYDQMNYTPQYAFGFGLSYTTFAYSNLKLSSATPSKGEPVTVTVDVQNTGTVAGDEVVQLYVSNLSAPVWMPKKELKGFQRITLNPGEKKTVTMILTAEHFYYFDEASDRYLVSPGNYIAAVGGSSDKLTLASAFKIIDAANRPDLKITRVYSYPKYPVQGDSVVFLALVKNQGTADVNAGTVSKLSFSVDGVQKTWNTTIPSVIPVGGALLISSSTGLKGSPYWIASTKGKHPVTAFIDLDGSISEWIESNNSYSDSITVADSTIYPNLALNKPITASSQENASLGATYANDGSLTTRWGSAFSDPQTLQIDLKANYNLNKINILWESGYAIQYKLEVSTNGTTWTPVENITNGDGGWDIYSNIQATGRYIRFTGLKRATPYGYSIYEIQAYGTPAIATDVQPYTTSGSLLIFPNPVHGQSKVFIPQADNTSVTVYNTIGQKVFTTMIDEDHQMDLGTITTTPGIYIVQFIKDGQVMTGRLMVE